MFYSLFDHFCSKCLLFKTYFYDSILFFSIFFGILQFLWLCISNISSSDSYSYFYLWNKSFRVVIWVHLLVKCWKATHGITWAFHCMQLRATTVQDPWAVAKGTLLKVPVLLYPPELVIPIWDERWEDWESEASLINLGMKLSSESLELIIWVIKIVQWSLQ